ncbi:Hypothetical predicted protein, partial [Paramuricea clavata]
GLDFRKDYSDLAMLYATFPTVPVVALTATASKADVILIKESLNLKKPNFYTTLQLICIKRIGLSLTILYLPLKWCGYAFKYLAKHLDKELYCPLDAEAKPENKLFAQFHSPQTSAMKNQILTELSSPLSKLRVVFATVALEMGNDMPCKRHSIHVGPPLTIREYFQETGRAGRDRKRLTAVLYYNKRDIAMSRPGTINSIREYCKLEDSCLRTLLLGCLIDAHDVMKDNPH